MLRLIPFLWLLIIAPNQLSGQISTDSLLAIVETLPDDQAKARFLEENVVGQPYKSFDDPVRLFGEQLSILKRSRARQREFDLALHLISAANFMGQFGLADSLSLHYVSKVEEVESVATRMELYHEAAKATFFGQQYEQAIDFDTTALSLIPLLEATYPKDSFSIDINNYLGKAYNASGQFANAVGALNDAIDLLATKDPSSKKLGEFYTELGIVYSQIGLYDRAVEYLNRTLVINPEPVAIGSNQINIGRNLLLTKKYAAARDRYLNVFELELPSNMEGNMLPYAYQGIIEAYYRLEKIDSLDFYFAKFEALLEDEDQRTDNFLFLQARLFHALAHNELSDAEANGLNLYQGAIEKKDPAERLMYTELLAELYQRRGDYREAYSYSQELLRLQDSIQGANRNNAILLYYNQFETKEKENQILRLDQERDRAEAKRKQYQIAAALLGLLLLTALLFYVQLRKARRRLAVQNNELNKLNATKDRFFSIIAHDLRNPIIALKTADAQVQRLYDRGKVEAVKKTLGVVSQTAGRLTGLLDNLLQWALGQSGAITLQKESLSLAAAVNENTNLYAPALEAKGLKFINKIEKDISIYADYNALQTILRNLIGNAVKFSPAQQDATITVSHHRKGEMDVITVSDEGPGIPPKDLERLFRLHQDDASESRRKSGTGLGLILCKEMAELHGGEVSVDTTIGSGTQFSISLPTNS